MNPFKKSKLEADLKTAQMDITPEMFRANAIVKAMLVGIMAIPTLFIFPLLCPVILILAVVLYSVEIKSVSKRIQGKRKKIEYELPRLVFNIEKTLKHSRDVLYMLESYMETAGPEMKHELAITSADMRSGNYEAAITRLESRVGSSMMSDVCRGRIGILRGDDTEMYWASLAIKFSDAQRQQLRIQAQQVPRPSSCACSIIWVVTMEQSISAELRSLKGLVQAFSLSPHTSSTTGASKAQRVMPRIFSMASLLSST